MPEGRYEGVAAEDLVRSCLIDRCLSQAIDRSIRPLSPVHADVHCWWAEDQDQAVINGMGSQLGAARMRHVHVAADHETIITSDRLLIDLTELLSAKS